MNNIEADKYKVAVDRKLAAEGVSHHNIEKAKIVLSRCVMGQKLCKAFIVLYEKNK